MTNEQSQVYRIHDGEVEISTVNWLLQNSGKECDLSKIPSSYSRDYRGEAEIVRKGDQFEYEIEIRHRINGALIYQEEGTLDSDIGLDEFPGEV